MLKPLKGCDARPVRDARDALLIVEVQRDFLPGGALAVPEGDTIVPAQLL